MSYCWQCLLAVGSCRQFVYPLETYVSSSSSCLQLLHLEMSRISDVFRCFRGPAAKRDKAFASANHKTQQISRSANGSSHISHSQDVRSRRQAARPTRCNLPETRAAADVQHPSGGPGSSLISGQQTSPQPRCLRMSESLHSSRLLIYAVTAAHRRSYSLGFFFFFFVLSSS